jgi:hypothetical protein
MESPTWSDSFGEDPPSHHFAVHLKLSASPTPVECSSSSSSSPDLFTPKPTKGVQPPPITISPRKHRWKTGISPWSIPSSLPSTILSEEVSPSSSELNCGEKKREPVGYRSSSCSPSQLRTVMGPQQEAPTVARATPFLPGISGGIWSPPCWPISTSPDKDSDDVSLKTLQS